MEQKESEPTDEQILRHEQDIKDQESQLFPLVGEREKLESLLKEYEAGSKVFRDKILGLRKHHVGIRRCRGDGNCFFRAFAFALYEHLQKNPSSQALARNVLSSTRELLLSSYFSPLAFEDFYDVTMNTLDLLPTIPPAALVNLFQDAEVSNSIVVHLRFTSSAYLRLNADEYMPFLEDGTDMETYCRSNVEAFGRESEEIHIIALSKALRVQVQVVYLDGSLQGGGEATVHEFNGADGEEVIGRIVLLYRPGHYDILYRGDDM